MNKFTNVLILCLSAVIAIVCCTDDILVGDLPEYVASELTQMLFCGLLDTTCNLDLLEIDEVQFFLYTRNNQQNAKLLTLANIQDLDTTKPFKFGIPGWLSVTAMKELLLLKDAYLNCFDVNFVIVNWSKAATQLYTTAYCKVPIIAQRVANFLCHLSKQLNVLLSTIHIIGHSLGAQMAGFIGQFTQNMCKQLIGRITGLDPAGPLYEGAPKNKRLDPSDAKFVEVIHTDAGKLGYLSTCGHADYYVDCGFLQRGCPDITWASIATTPLSAVICNHMRCFNYFTEAVCSNDFIARSCSSCPKRCRGDRFNPAYIIMGENTTLNPHKTVYEIPTNCSPPYGLGCSAYSSCSGCSRIYGEH